MDRGKILKYGFIFLGFIILLVGSEVVYTVKNNDHLVTSVLTKVYVTISRRYLSNSELDKSLTYLNLAAQQQIKSSRISFPGKIPDNIPEAALENVDFAAKSAVEDILKEKFSNKDSEVSAELIANIYYHIGLTLYNEGYHNKAKPFLSTSRYITPAVSFLHVELANSYFRNNEIEKGTEVLEYCQEFPQTKVHCTEYLENSVPSEEFIPVGGYEESIDNYHYKKSKP